jgi:protein SCO1/2
MLLAIRAFALVLLVALGGVWAWAWVTRAPGEGLAEAFAARITRVLGGELPIPSAGGGVQLPQGLALGGPFALIDEAGRPVTEADFGGRWLLLYFGYTFCPDVCPTELGTVAAAIDALGADAERVVPVFITIDPERDQPALIADYVARFHPRLRGLTGSPQQIAEAARRYRVYYAKTRRAEAADYLMDHSSFIYLVGPDARVRALFRPETAPEAIAGTVAAHLRGGDRRPADTPRG